MTNKIKVNKHMDKLLSSDVSVEEKTKLAFELIDNFERIHGQRGMWSVEDCQFLIDMSNRLEFYKKERMDYRRKIPLSVLMLEKALTVRTFSDLGKEYDVRGTTVIVRLQRYLRCLFGEIRREIDRTQEKSVRRAVEDKIMSRYYNN